MAEMSIEPLFDWSEKNSTRSYETHGFSTLRNRVNGKLPKIYTKWRQLKQRCDNPKHPDYPRYGGRGISYEPSWKDFAVFYADMIAGYDEPLTLDRIDVDGNYCKSNCRWADRRLQANNTRRNRNLTVNGVTKSITAWCRDLNLNIGTITSRLRYGFTPEQALFTPVRKITPHTRTTRSGVVMQTGGASVFEDRSPQTALAARLKRAQSKAGIKTVMT